MFPIPVSRNFCILSLRSFLVSPTLPFPLRTATASPQNLVPPFPMVPVSAKLCVKVLLKTIRGSARLYQWIGNVYSLWADIKS